MGTKRVSKLQNLPPIWRFGAMLEMLFALLLFITLIFKFWYMLYILGFINEHWSSCLSLLHAGHSVTCMSHIASSFCIAMEMRVLWFIYVHLWVDYEFLLNTLLIHLESVIGGISIVLSRLRFLYMTCCWFLGTWPFMIGDVNKKNNIGQFAVRCTRC